MQQYGCLDYKGSRTMTKDIAPAFRAGKIIRQIDKDDMEDNLFIQVNDHFKSKSEFELSISTLYASQPVLAELCKHKIVMNPKWESAIRDYLIDEYKRCEIKELIEYRHQGLGWTDIGGKEVFLYDKNIIGNKTSICNRKDFKFCSGDKQVYEDFLKNTVYPVPTLALAMSIGYSAVRYVVRHSA